MRITPLEIRQKTFEKKLRGYDKDDVQAFLTSLSQEWERTLDETKELKIKLEAAEKEVSKLREVENSLFKTLKTAEDTGANVVEQAKKAADLHMREVQWKAEALINDSKTNSRNIIEEAEVKSRQIISDMEEELKTLEQEYRSLEKMRQNLVSELRTLAGDTLERVEDLARKTRSVDIEDKVKQAKKQARSVLEPTGNAPEPPPAPKAKKSKEVKEEVPVEEAEPEKNGHTNGIEQQSFFDSID